MTGSGGRRRPAGTGSLFLRHGGWYGQWRSNGRLVKRKLGPKRSPGQADGLTRIQAEKRLRELMQSVRAPLNGRLPFGEAGDLYVAHLESVLERKPSTIEDYRSMLRRHFAPFFRGRPLDSIDADQVVEYMRIKRAEGLTSKTIRNHIMFLHGVFVHAIKRGWAATNPVAAVDRPVGRGFASDVRFLTNEELNALIRSVPTDDLGALERTLYLVAGMTGLRQGELIALRWRDVDWTAGVVRVRRSISRGRLGTPKSRYSSRAVPMADAVGRALDQHHRQTAFTGDDDLVFAHPQTGRPYDPSKMRRRFKQALRQAGLRDLRFHDLRHTFGTHMAMAGAPLRALQEWMGHRDYATTAIYADYAPDPSGGRRWATRAFDLNGSQPANTYLDVDRVDAACSGSAARTEIGTRRGRQMDRP